MGESAPQEETTTGLIVMLVKILSNGGTVEQGGHEYAMAEDGSLCVVMHDEAGNERAMKVDCDLAGLKRLADDIGRDELWLRCCGLQLRKISST